MTTVQIASPTDQLAISGTINEIGMSADLKDWVRVRVQLADEVFVDYTSLMGGDATLQKADDLIASWQSFLPGFTTTQHVITNHRVSIQGERATVVSQFIATHRLVGAPGGELWTLGGRYQHTLHLKNAGWKVVAMTMIWAWQTGNTELPKLAAKRAASH